MHDKEYVKTTEIKKHAIFKVHNLNDITKVWS